jgi:HD-GYP domain-containing protein (c-di-GMP phosphodiesterase class II)
MESNEVILTPISQQCGTLLNLMKSLSGALAGSPADQDVEDILTDIDKRLHLLRQMSEEREGQYSRLQALVEIGQAFNSSVSIRPLLSTVLDTIIQISGAERSFLMLENEDGQLSVRVGRNWEQENLSPDDSLISRSIVGRVVEEGESILTSNALADPRFRDEDSIANYKLRSILCVPIKIKQRVIGVIYADNHAQAGLFTEEDGAFLTAFANQAALAIEKAVIFDQYQTSNHATAQAYDATILAWAKAMEERDYETPGHSERVISLLMRLAKAMGVDEENLMHYRRGAILHDVGKLAIPEAIMLKPGALSEGEWELVRLHPETAYQWLNHVIILHPCLDIVRHHHERWDGAGYPKGLAGEKIPLSARLFSVVDVWDSLLHTRPYKKAWTKKDTMDYLRSQVNVSFDGQIVDVFLEKVILSQSKHP